MKGNAHVNFSKPIAENVQGHNSAIFEATDPIFWEVCPLGGYFWKTQFEAVSRSRPLEAIFCL